MFSVPANFPIDGNEPKSQVARVFALLAKGETLTSMFMIREMGIQRPAAVKLSLTQIGAVISGNGRMNSPYKLEGFTTALGIPKNLPLKKREHLFVKQKGRCNLCKAKRALKELQADHRIPHAIVGNKYNFENKYWQLVCRSCNSSKRAQCEECPTDNEKSCFTCRLVHPENGQYTHVAGTHNLSIVSSFSQEQDRDFLDRYAQETNTPPDEVLQKLLREKYESSVNQQ